MNATAEHILGRIKLGEKTLFGFSTDTVMFLSILIAVNIQLILGSISSSLIYFPSAVGNGEWWRVFTHPFVHVTWYHFLLDAGAFMIIYAGLEDKRILNRLMYVFACGGGSLGAVLLFSPSVNTQGLCGISGIAHGLMAISALEMMQSKNNFKIGIGCLVVLSAKCVYEIITGDVFFAFLHFSLCGSPLVACHAGGVVGGVASFLLMRQKPFAKR